MYKLTDDVEMGCVFSGESTNQEPNESERNANSAACMSACATRRIVPDKKIKITGCTFMDNGFLVTVDINNRRIKLYDPHLKCCSFVHVEHRPFDICAIDNHLYVTFPKKKLIQKLTVTWQIVCIKRKLLKRLMFPTEGESRGIVAYNKDLIVSAKFLTHADTEITESTWQIQIISTDGRVKRRIAHRSEGSALFNDAKYIALTPSKHELVVSEAEDNRIKCLDIKTGELTFNHDMDDPRGVTCDKHGNIYVLGKQGVIRWILADREYSKVLIKGTSGLHYSECITYFKKTNTLAVPRNENKIELYKIKNSIRDG